MNPTNPKLTEARIETLFQIIDELLAELKRYDPELQKAFVTNSKLNDYYLIRVGAK